MELTTWHSGRTFSLLSLRNKEAIYGWLIFADHWNNPLIGSGDHPHWSASCLTNSSSSFSILSYISVILLRILFIASISNASPLMFSHLTKKLKKMMGKKIDLFISVYSCDFHEYFNHKIYLLLKHNRRLVIPPSSPHFIKKLMIVRPQRYERGSLQIFRLSCTFIYWFDRTLLKEQ